MKNKIIGFILILLMIGFNIFPIIVYGNNNIETTEKIKNENIEKEDKIEKIKNDNEQEDTESYTEEYKKWLELSEEEKAKYEIVPRKYKVPFSVLYEDNTGIESSSNLKRKKIIKATEEEQIPESFDLRDKIEIPVRNQGGHGLCWAFTSLKTLETYLSLNGYGDFDFSENHLAYLENPEWLEEEKNNTKSSPHGEFEKYACYRLGPVFENETPYDVEYSKDEIEDLLEIEPKAYVGDIKEFPRIDKSNNEYSQEEIDLFRNKVKEHIMKNGALYCAINSHGIDYNNKYNVLNYQGNDISDHAVCIIGWDDNFSKENFSENNRPQNDGAYIAINSWGENWGENGIFYISYEDQYVDKEIWGINEASTNIEDLINEYKFEDVNLYDAIKDILGRTAYDCDDETLTIYATELAIKNVRVLNLENRNISNLEGLECFKNVVQLYLNNNNIEDIEVLSNFNNLVKFDLSNNNIENIEALDLNTNYKYLKINLENNNIKDISPLENYYKIDVSGNPIQSGIDKLENVYELDIGNCTLSNEQLLQISNLPLLYYLGLQNDNIQDVSFLKNHETLQELDLSKNKELSNLNQLNNITILNLSDCELNDDIIDEFNQFEKLVSLNLSKNNITNTEKLRDLWRVSTLDLSYTNITDVTNLSEKRELNLSGNKNLTNLDKLYSVTYLTLDNCEINDFSFIDNLNRISSLSLKENGLKSLPEFNNTNIYYLYLNDNEINDITNIAELANKINSSIYLSNNLIEKIPDDITERKNIYFNNNRITERPDNRFHFCENQKIEKEYELELNKENVISLPQIFKLSLNYSYNYLMDLKTENCTVDRKKGEIIIKPTQLGEGHASVKIENDQYGNEGTYFDINYITKSSIDYTKLELGETNYKDAYIEGEDFDNSKLEVKYVTEDGVSKLVADYEIINGSNLQEGQQNVIIKYNDIELEVPIQVYSSDSCEVEFDVRLYYNLAEQLNENILYSSVEKNIVKCIIKREAIENLNKICLSTTQMGNDYTGLSSLFNLKEIEIKDMNIYNQKNLISEICKLNQIEKLDFMGCDFDGNVEINENELKKLLNLESIKSIEFRRRYMEENKNIKNKKYYLPKYLERKDIDNVQVECEYVIGYEEDGRDIENETLPIYVDDNGKLYIMYDTEVGENKLYSNRKIYINISTDKIKENIELQYFWNREVVKPKVDITVEPLVNNIANSNTLKYTFNWDEEVYGFTEDSIIVENGEKAEFEEIEPNKIYTLIVTNNIEENQEGIQKVIINENVCTDLASNGNERNEKEILIKIAPSIMLGDVTGDGRINIRDIIKIRKYIANQTKWELTDEQKASADVDKNNKINIRDIIKIRKYIAASSSSSIAAKHPEWLNL